MSSRSGRCSGGDLGVVKALRYGPAALLSLTIFVLSSIPGHKLGWVFGWDKALHAIEYGTLGAAYLRALDPAATRARLAGIAWVLAALFGVSDEIHQLFTPGRSADVRDVIADAIGAALGVLAYRAVCARRRELR